MDRLYRRNFCIYAPPFDHTSAGIVMLYLLNDSLVALGETSKIVLWGQTLDPDDREAIVIYPEVIHDNPLGAKCVARYLLNKDGVICGKKIERTGKQYIFTYSRIFDPDADLLFFPNFDSEILNFDDDIEKRSLQIMYFGKGPSFSPTFDGLEPWLLITKKWPQDRDLLVRFLKLGRFLHLSDSVTALSFEALLCGCIPLIHVWNESLSSADYERAEFKEVLEINSEKDFSTKNVLKKIMSSRQKLISYQQEWPNTLRAFVQNTQRFFN